MEGACKLAIIADDFTGACDTGVQFRKQGLKTIVVVAIEDIGDVIGEVDAIVVDTESRSDPPKLAYEKVRETTRALKNAGIKFLYKKIDSTLRGNIGSELDAAMDEVGAKMSIIAPAYPANGRVTVGGYQLVHGVPVARTEFANDPVNPVKESHVPSLVQSQTRRKVGYLDLYQVVKGVESLVDGINSQREAGKEIIVIDAAVQDDLRKIAEAIVASSMAELTCGSAGVAQELPKALGLTVSRPVVVIAGSIRDVVRQQILRAMQVFGAHVIEIDSCRILEGEDAKEEEVHRVLKEAVQAMVRGRDVIITSAGSEESVTRAWKKGEQLGMRRIEIAEAISLVLGEIADEITEHTKIAGIILTGGSVASNACKIMGAKGTIIEDEVLPGIPVGRLLGGKRDGLRVVTKAGGFGDENAIVKAIECLRRVL